MLSIHPTGVLPIITSLSVPPPTAVTNVIISTPNKSIFLSMDTNAPDMAKASVPIRSNRLNIIYFQMVGFQLKGL